MFAGFEILAFDGFLRSFDSARDHARFDGNTFFHAKALQQVRNPLLGEDPHEGVWERKRDARRAGVALTARASAKLICIAARLVAFRAEDVQPARLDHFLVLTIGVYFVASKNLVPLIGRNRVLVAGVVPNRAVGIVDIGFDLALRGADRLRDSLLHALLLGHEFGITAKQNIRAAAGHIGSDSDSAFAPGLRNNFRLAFVVLRVEHYVILQSLFLEKLGKALRLLD